MKTYDEMADEVFRRRDEYIINQKKRRKKTLSATLACVAVVALLGVGIWQSGNLGLDVQMAADAMYPGIKDTYGPGTDEPLPPLNAPNKLTETNEPERIDSRTLISRYDGEYGNACYVLPHNKDAYCSIPLNKAFEEYGDEVIYRVIVRVFKDDKGVTGKKKLEEVAKILYGMGYKCAVEVMNGKDSEAILTMLVTEEELKNFKADDEHGYFFFLYEGDF